jgi:hypothetical protein
MGRTSARLALEDELSYSTTNISILLQKGVQGLKYERLEKDIRKSSGAKV